MFTNLISLHDATELFRRSGEFIPKIASRIFRSRAQRTRSAWSGCSREAPGSWWDLPAIRRHWNSLISGDINVDFYRYIEKTRLQGKNSLYALSLGCGTGHAELRWAQTGIFTRIDAYDLSEQRILHARQVAEKQGVGDIVAYAARDIYAVELIDNHYDIIFAVNSLHHFTPLEVLLKRIHTSLKPGGLFIVNDFVGPARFQWSDRQLQAMNSLLNELPGKYRRYRNSRFEKKKMYRPGRLRMIFSDPSEAVESSAILPLLHTIFKVEEIKGYGGTILHPVLSGIAQNFPPDDPDADQVLQRCIDFEDNLLKRGEIDHDFVVAVCSRRG